MTTRLELQQWLNQFPETALMEVLISRENNRYGYDSYISVHETAMVIEPVASEEEHPYYQEGQTFTVTRNSDGTMTVVFGRTDA